MKLATAALLLAACAAPAPRPPPRVADQVQVQQIQVGWLQLASGRPDRPPVEILNGGRAPDEVEAGEIAQNLLDKCRKGAPMEPLQKQYSEEPPGTFALDAQSKSPLRDQALALQPGECALVRSNSALHVIKRVQ
jgi:hypothetical protein